MFVSPLPGLARAFSGWGEPRPYRGGVHEGVDLAAEVGTPVYAMADGVVDGAVLDPCNTAGMHVAILHADGWRSVSMHFSRVDVRRGQQVVAGQQIGLSGRTGGAQRGPGCTFDPGTASHVHITIRRVAGRAHESPATGTMRAGFVAVPAEPIVPAAWDQDIIDRVRAWGWPPVAARTAVAAGGGIVVLILTLVAGIWWVRRRRRRRGQ